VIISIISHLNHKCYVDGKYANKPHDTWKPYDCLRGINCVRQSRYEVTGHAVHMPDTFFVLASSRTRSDPRTPVGHYYAETTFHISNLVLFSAILLTRTWIAIGIPLSQPCPSHPVNGPDVWTGGGLGFLIAGLYLLAPLIYLCTIMMSLQVASASLWRDRSHTGWIHHQHPALPL
jgi:hypothetical protein